MTDTPETENKTGSTSDKSQLNCNVGSEYASANTRENNKETGKHINNGKHIFWFWNTIIWKPVLYICKGFSKGFSYTINLLGRYDGAVTAVATIIIAIATIHYTVYAKRQWKVTRDQLTEMRSSSSQTDNTIAALNKQAGIMQGQLDEMRTENRPWIKADIEVGGPLFYNINGANLTLTFHLTNIGHFPATHVWINAEIITRALGVDYDLFDKIDINKKIAEIKKSPPIPWGYTIFPGETLIQNVGLSISKDEMKRITQKADFISPWIIGAVDYSFVSNSIHHYTGFVIEVLRSNEARQESTIKKRSPATIFPDEGDIPATDLRLMKNPINTEYVD